VIEDNLSRGLSLQHGFEASVQILASDGFDHGFGLGTSPLSREFLEIYVAFDYTRKTKVICFN